MMDSRKQAVSIRMSSGDIRNVKKLAKRLGVRDSDVIRLAVKAMLARLGPLNDSSLRGRSLVPVFVESGNESSVTSISTRSVSRASSTMEPRKTFASTRKTSSSLL